MEQINITKNDIEWLNELIKTTSSIDKLYERLAELEINNQKDSEEYSKLLEYLKISLEVEEELYSKENLTVTKCQNLTEYIAKHFFNDSFDEDIEYLITQDQRSRVMRRILSYFVKIIVYNDKAYVEMVPESVKNFLESVGDSNAEDTISSAIYQNTEIYKSLNKDLFHIFVALIDEYSKIKTNSSIRDNLVRAKYQTSFINKEIEKEMLETDFETSETITISSPFVSLITDAGKELYDILRNRHCYDEASEQIARILDIENHDYADPEKRTSIILRQCYLRACLALLDEEKIETIDSIFHHLLEDKNYLKFSKLNSKSEMAVSFCLRKVNKDKERIAQINLETLKK